MQVLVEFGVANSARYLSHAETSRVFERAMARADLPVVFTQGFNPHPRFSLALPRSVGVEAEGELLCVRVADEQIDVEQFRSRLAEQMPDGFQLHRATVAAFDDVPQPVSAEYVLVAKKEFADNRLKERIEGLLAGTTLEIERQADGRTRKVDVRPYLKTIRMEARQIVVECTITPAGTIRVDEITRLLGLGVEDLAAAVRRMNVRWRGLGDREPPSV